MLLSAYDPFADEVVTPEQINEYRDQLDNAPIESDAEMWDVDEKSLARMSRAVRTSSNSETHDWHKGKKKMTTQKLAGKLAQLERKKDLRTRRLVAIARDLKELNGLTRRQMIEALG